MNTNYSVGRKILYVFLGFLVLPAAELLQLAVTIPATIGVLAQSMMENPGSIASLFEQFLKYLLNGYLGDVISIGYSIAAIIAFGLWFFFVFRKDHGRVLRGRNFSITVLVGLILLAVALQFFCEIVVSGTELLFPGSLQAYEELTEMAGFNEPTTGIYIYGIFIGPIAEELIFRGVSLHYFKRAMPFFLANIFQAVLFGIYHLNLVQGVYAFVVGMIFGLVMSTGRSILYSILLHIIFNAFGFTDVLSFGSDTRWYFYLWMPAMVLLFALSLILYFEPMNRKNALKESFPKPDI